MRSVRHCFNPLFHAEVVCLGLRRLDQPAEEGVRPARARQEFGVVLARREEGVIL